MAINTLGQYGTFPTTQNAPYSGASMSLHGAELSSVRVRPSGAFELSLKMASQQSVTNIVVHRSANGALSTTGVYANASGKAFTLPREPLGSDQARAVLEILQASSKRQVPEALLGSLNALAKQQA
mgnify:CR=1 FL=1